MRQWHAEVECKKNELCPMSCKTGKGRSAMRWICGDCREYVVHVCMKDHIAAEQDWG